MHDIDIEGVAALIEQVALAELIPRFRDLDLLAVHAKPSAEDPSDVVTEADIAAELALTDELLARAPGSIVIGEEAVSRDPSLRNALEDAQRAWLVDPLDGTKNFAAGKNDWGSMITLCEKGDAIACWIHLPLTGETFVAQRGAGAWLGGRRLSAAAPPPGDVPLAGTTYTRFMPPALRARVESNAAAHLRHVPGAWSAAHEYTRLALGEKDFAIWWRLLPWDHAPGALLLQEAGGAMLHGDGRAYRAADIDTLAIAVRHASLWDRARVGLLG